MKKTTLFLISTVFAFGAMAEPVKFDDVTAFYEDFNDFPPGGEFPRFKVLNENPLSIQLSPMFLPNEVSAENNKYVQERIQQAAVYGVYRTYTHTNYDGDLKVTILPVIFDSDNSNYLDDKKISFSINQKDALKLLNEFSGITSFDDLVESDEFAEWKPEFENCCYSSGEKLDQFFKNLTAKKG